MFFGCWALHYHMIKGCNHVQADYFIHVQPITQPMPSHITPSMSNKSQSLKPSHGCWHPKTGTWQRLKTNNSQIPMWFHLGISELLNSVDPSCEVWQRSTQSHAHPGDPTSAGVSSYPQLSPHGHQAPNGNSSANPLPHLSQI